jgi:hypothetical protein
MRLKKNFPKFQILCLENGEQLCERSLGLSFDCNLLIYYYYAMAVGGKERKFCLEDRQQLCQRAALLRQDDSEPGIVGFRT